VQRLTSAELTGSADLAKEDDAKQGGSWYALDAVEALEIGRNLERALDERHLARQRFGAFPRCVMRGIRE